MTTDIEMVRDGLASATFHNGGTAFDYLTALSRIEDECARLRAALVRIADGDVPWADGMVRAGYKDAHDLQAFARQALEGSKG